MSSPDSGAHLDLDALADLAADPQAEGAAHVAGCQRCSGVLEQLRSADADLQQQLAALPQPALPTDVASRIDQALQQPAQNPETPAPAVPLRAPASGGRAARRRAGSRAAPRSRPSAPSWLPAAAAASVLIAGGGLAYSLMSSRGSLQSASSAGGSADSAAGSTAPEVRRLATGTDYGPPQRSREALTAALPSLLGEPGAPAAAPQPAGDALATTSEGSSDRTSPDKTSTDTTSDPLARLRDPAALAGCLNELLPPDDPSVRPLAVDEGMFAGRPALTVLLSTNDPRTVQAYVVGAGCRPGEDETLTFAQLPRP